MGLVNRHTPKYQGCWDNYISYNCGVYLYISIGYNKLTAAFMDSEWRGGRTMKKLITAVVLFLTLLIFAGTAFAEPKRVSLIVNGDPVSDDYTAACIEGMDYAQKRFLRRVATKVFNCVDKRGGETDANILEAAAQWSDVVILNGGDFSGLIGPVAEKYPNVIFVMLDGFSSKARNTYTINFRDEEAGFLAGALAAIVAKRPDIDRIDPESGKIGLILGAKTAPIDKFRVGYIAGAWYIDKKLKVVLDYVGNFNDTAKAREIALRMRGENVRIIFAAAGKAGLGAIAAAKDNGYWMLGVDVAQEAKYPDAVLSSIVKRSGHVILKIIENVVNGKISAEKYFSLGAAEQCIDVSTWTRESKQNLPPDIREQMDEISDKLENKLIIIK